MRTLIILFAVLAGLSFGITGGGSIMGGGGSAPSVRLTGGVLPKIPAASFVDTIDVDDWAAVSSTETKETTLVKCGTASSRYTAALGASALTRGCSRDFGEGTEKDLTGCVITVRYYIDPTFAAQMTSTGSYIVFYDDDGTENKWILGNTPQGSGWNEFSFSPSMGAFSGAMSDWASVRKISILHSWPAGSGTFYFVLDELTARPHGKTKGAVMFQFDDGIQSSYLNGIRYLAKYGFPSVFYISPEVIVNSGETRFSTAYGDFCTWDEVKSAESLGALIATHSTLNGVMPTSSKSALRNWCAKQKRIMIEHGYGVGSEYFCVPKGQVTWYNGVLSEQEIMDVCREYFLHIRGTQPRWNNVAASDGSTCGNVAPQPYIMHDNRWGWAMGGTGDVSYFTDRIDWVIAHKEVAAFYLHNLTDATALTTAEFRQVVDYAKTKVDAGTLDVITYADLMR